MEKNLSKFISYLLHPSVMPLIGMYFLLNSPTYLTLINPIAKNYLYVLVFILTFIFPIASAILNYKLKLIDSLLMETRQERVIPYFVTSIFFFVNYFTLKKIPIYQSISDFYLGVSIVISLVFLLNFKWKISSHMAGIGGIVGLILGLSVKFGIDYSLLFSILILLSGILGYARLYLKSHKPYQIYIGFIIGFITVLSFYIFD